ncbi:MAG: hypothetical protein R3E96_02540 [Planctomycetota bacterium]
MQALQDGSEGECVESLREQDWPVENLLLGIARTGELELARASVRVLGEQSGQAVQQSLWSLRGRDGLQVDVVQALIASAGLTGERVQRAWFEGLAADSIVAAWQGLAPADSLRLAQELQHSGRRRAWQDAEVQTLCGLLENAREAGLEQGFAWIAEGALPAEPLLAWATSHYDFQSWLPGYIERTPAAAAQIEALFTLATRRPQIVPLDWLVERAGEYRHQARALSLLAVRDGFEDLQALRGLRRTGVDADLWLAAWQNAIDRDGPRALELARRLAGAEPELCAELAQELQWVEKSNAALALTALCTQSAGNEPWLEDALQHVAACGDARCLEPLRDWLLGLRDWQAAPGPWIVLALYDLAGPKDFEPLFADLVGADGSRAFDALVNGLRKGQSKRWKQRGYLIAQRLGRLRQALDSKVTEQ